MSLKLPRTLYHVTLKDHLVSIMDWALAHREIAGTASNFPRLPVCTRSVYLWLDRAAADHFMDEALPGQLSMLAKADPVDGKMCAPELVMLAVDSSALDLLDIVPDHEVLTDLIEQTHAIEQDVYYPMAVHEAIERAEALMDDELGTDASWEDRALHASKVIDRLSREDRINIALWCQHHPVIHERCLAYRREIPASALTIVR